MYWKSLFLYLLLPSLLPITLAAQNLYSSNFSYDDGQTTKEHYGDFPLVDGRQFHYQKLDKVPLAYPYVREADVLWGKRIWREIPVAQKGNVLFRNKQQPFVSILLDILQHQPNTRKSIFTDDTFTKIMDYTSLQNRLNTKDTISVIDPITAETTATIVLNEFNWRSVKKFRIKEDYAFDSRHSRMIVRILGIAPIREVYDDHGNYRGEEALFWLYYPDFRRPLATYEAFSLFEEGLYYSWEDILELRYFDSRITKESNVRDERIEDQYVGKEASLESQRIQKEMFAYEQELWSY